MRDSLVADRPVALAGESVLDVQSVSERFGAHGIVALLQGVRRSPTAIVGVALLLVWVVCAIAWPVLAPYDPNQFHTSARLQPPSAQFWFGTDQFGRDVFSRVLAGSRD